jgi:hypothetical protein
MVRDVFHNPNIASYSTSMHRKSRTESARASLGVATLPAVLGCHQLTSLAILWYMTDEFSSLVTARHRIAAMSCIEAFITA